jgi:precorrin-6B methylase 2
MLTSILKTLLLTLLAVGLGLPLGTLPSALAAPTATYETRASHSPDGTGTFYYGREIAQMMGPGGINWLERPDRAREEQTQKALDALPFKSTDVVADIGAGSGYFSFRIAPKVAKVLAVDVQPEMVEILKQNQQAQKIDNVEPRLGGATDPNLAAESLDWALMVDAYHEFEHPREMMEALLVALKPGGRMALLEYKGENPLIMIKPLHKMTQTQVRAELTAIGLEFVENKRVLPQQHLLIFRKPMA